MEVLETKISSHYGKQRDAEIRVLFPLEVKWFDTGYLEMDHVTIFHFTFHVLVIHGRRTRMLGLGQNWNNFVIMKHSVLTLDYKLVGEGRVLCHRVRANISVRSEFGAQHSYLPGGRGW